MKHNKYLIFSLLGLVTLMSSCSNEENINSDRSATLSASIEETPATRLYMDGTTNKWTTGDAMKVWSDNTSTANDFTVVAGGNALADITGTQPTRTSVFYAVASKSNGNFVSGSGATAYVKFNVDDVSTANEMTSSNANFKNIMVGATDNGGNATISAVSNAVASGDNAYTTSTTGQAQVSASPLNSSYTFVGWYKNDGTQISTTTPLTITIKDYDSQTLIARWKATWTGNGADAGTVPNGGTINVP